MFVFNFLSPIFFSAHQIGIALVVILLVLAAILAFIATAWRQDLAAAWRFMHYAAWVAFAAANCRARRLRSPLPRQASPAGARTMRPAPDARSG